MVDKIQPTQHRQSQYDRMAGKWRCDGTRYGSPCAEGVNPNGSCPHAKKAIRPVCQPTKQEGKFQCERSEQYGGSCHNGPDEMGNCGIQLPACRPKIGNINNRIKWSRYMMILGAALLAIIVGSKHIMAWVQPDNLSLYHRNISECQTCHIGLDENIETWWAQGIHNFWSNAYTERYSCENCHQFNGPAMKAHNYDQPTMLALQNAIYETSDQKSFAKNIACHQCHKEHEGQYGLDALLDNNQCQSCHLETFNSFDNSHPEFSSFPEIKNQRPLFDHVKHLKRFTQKKYQSLSPENCQACHLPDMADEVVIPSFDQACQGCHLEKDILNVGGKEATAISWLSVPRFDAEALNIGLWPNCKTLGLYSIDDISPITLSYLNNYPEVESAIKLLTESDIRFDKSEQASEQELEAMTTLAWGFKKMLLDLKNNQDIHWRISESTKSEEQDDSQSKLAKINPDLLTVFILELFPQLEQELEQSEQQEQLSGQCISNDQLKVIKKKWGKSKINTLQGWFIQVNSKTMELGYRTQQHMDSIQQNIMDQYWLQPDLFQWLTEKKKSLNCQKCHSQNSTGDGWVWYQEPARFSTHFFHKPHIISTSNCHDCHQISDENVDSQSDTATAVLQSDFNPMNKQDCQSCHHPNGSTVQCTDCHNYHQETIMINDKELNW